MYNTKIFRMPYGVIVEKSMYDYYVGCTIKNGSEGYKCVDIVEVEDEVYYIFNESIKYTWN